MATPPTAITLGLHSLELAHQAQIEAEIQQLVSLVELAEHYQINDDCMYAIAVGERWMAGGADGTPEVGEFLANEIGPILGISAASTAGRIAQALNLKYRHPRLWKAVLDGSVRAWQADRIVSACSTAGLDVVAAEVVDRQVSTALQMMPWTRVMRHLPAWIIKADPALAAERARIAAENRHITVGKIEDGHTDVWGRLSGADGVALDQALDLLADELLALTAQQETISAPSDTSPASDSTVTGVADPLRLKDARRAHALGLMARAVLGQDPLAGLPFEQPDIDCAPDTHVDFEVPGNPQVPAALTTPTHQGSPMCSHRLGVPDTAAHIPSGLAALSTLARCVQHPTPRKADLLVRINHDTAADPATGVADINGWGTILANQLTELLSGSHVRVIPVIDTAAIQPVDSYSIPDRMRWALQTRNRVEVFPYGTTDVARCDLDHITAFNHHNNVGVGQTRLDNLAPLGRRAHRAKTHGGWRAEAISPGWLKWESPAGRRYLVGPPGTFPLRDKTRTLLATAA